MSARIAAIDFGTNTARLLIADLCGTGCFEHVCLEREIVRMGGGFSRERGLSEEAWERGMACLTRFGAIIREHGVARTRAVATSAVRDAVNGAEFVEQVRGATGISLEVIEGTEEGRLTLAGVMAGLDRQYDEALIFDVGGGSTEYTVARGGEARFIHSLPIGVVRLTEGKVTPDAIQDKIGRELEQLGREMEMAGCRLQPGSPLIGTAGTATTLAAISMEMQDYDYRKVNNAVVSREKIREIYDRLLPLSPEERLAVPGLEKGREDLIIAGMLITLQTMEMFGADALKVSDYGLLEGLVVSGECGDSLPDAL
jgi:exopolyphosphatase/guanosine-5'-triphosphate,3'-diphosphate pyrophosphatase